MAVSSVVLLLQGQVTLRTPILTPSNTVKLSVIGPATNIRYDIYFTNALATTNWPLLVTGALNQVDFELVLPDTNWGFFRVSSNYVANSNPPPQVAMPVFSPAGVTNNSNAMVTVTCPTDYAYIYYTTDESTPTTASTYLSPGGKIAIARRTVLKARGIRDGLLDSEVATGNFFVNTPPAVYGGPQQVTNGGDTVTLQGVAADDGLMNATLSNYWRQVTGPGTVTFDNVNATNPAATMSDDGIYTVQLESYDGYWTSTGTVTIARNPTISVYWNQPTYAATFTVPTNILLQATATTGSGGITQVLFYAGSTLIGTATNNNSMYSLEWKNVPAGNHSLSALAFCSDPTYASLSSTTLAVTVNFPTNIGQFTLATTDLQIPAPGLPIIINRSHDPRFESTNSFGRNGRLDYDTARIEKRLDLSSGWTGTRSGINYCMVEGSDHWVVVSMSQSEQYYFKPRFIFTSSSNECKTASQSPSGYNFHTIRLEFLSANGLGQLSVPTVADLGMDDDLDGWAGVITPKVFVDGWPDTLYEPDLSEFTFTATDGLKYKFNTDGTLYQKTDRNNNSLTYAPDSIAHSSGQTVMLTRSNGFIAEIYDPIAISSNGAPALKYSYAGNGNLTNVARLVNRAGSGTYVNTGYAYDDTRFPYSITQVIDGRGITVISNTYDSSGRLQRQYDALGNYTSYSYEQNGRRQVVTDKNQRTTYQDYTDAGLVSRVQDGAGAVTSYQYDSMGRKLAQINALGATSLFAYSDNDDLIGVTNEIGASASATYNSYGQPLVVLDNLGYGTTNAYDIKGNLTAVTNALKIVSRYKYDSKGNRLTETNAFGLTEAAWTTNGYNSSGYLTNVTDSLGNRSTYIRDNNGNRIIERRERTLPSGSKQALWTTNVFDAANRIIAVIEPDGYRSATVYDAAGKVAYTTNKLALVTRFDYDARGLLTNTVFALGTAQQASESVGYDNEGRRTRSTDRAGRTVSYAYDKAGRLTKTSFPDDAYTENRYDQAGRLATTVQWSQPLPSSMSPAPRNTQATTFLYDAAGRRVGLVNALGQTNLFAFDANGNQTNTVDALGRAVTYTFDRLNRQTKVTYPDTTSERFGYDGLNRRVTVTNQADVVARFGFDKVGRLVAVTNGFGASVSQWATYAYDEAGNQTNQVDALGRMTRFEFDALGRKIRTVQPGGQTEGFAFDAGGNQIRYTNFNGVILTNQYDALNRLTNKTSGSYFVRFTYSSTGQRATMADASGNYSYLYDCRDRLTTNSGPVGTLVYAFDEFGRLTTSASMTANGVSLTYQYDALNRLTIVADSVAGTSGYGFDAVGNLQSLRYPNAVTNTYSYSSLNRLTNLTAKSASGTLASFAYQLGTASNRTNLIELVNGVSRTSAWQYDALYRLTNETITGTAPIGAVAYQYDAVGNRTNRTSTLSGLTNQTLAYVTNDWLASDVYDNNGNTRTNGGNVYQYDVEGRLTNATVGGVSASYTYNADGTRVSKTTGGTTTLYLVDDRNPTGYAQVLEELTSSGGVTNLAMVYSYGLDLISQRNLLTGTQSFFGSDGNGNTRYLAGANGVITDTYGFDAFGTVITSSGSTTNNYLYAGEQYDPTLGLYYLRARYLNAGMGRFCTRDVFEGFQKSPLSLHKYLYCQANPINGVDPSGHEFNIISIQTVTMQYGVLAARLAPAIAAGAKWAKNTLAGAQRVVNLAQTVVANGGDIVAYEDQVQRAIQGGVQLIGKARLDLVVRLPGRDVNTLIESKGVPWNLWGTSGWQGYIDQLVNQASKFAQANQAANGATIGERVISFTTRIPPGLEEAGAALNGIMRTYYNQVLFGDQALQQFLSQGL